MVIAIIFTCSIVLVIIFIIYANKDARRIRMVHKNYPMLLRALLDATSININSLSNEQRKLILSLSDDDWMDWAAIKKNQHNIAEEYSSLFIKYILEQYPQITERNNYSIKGKISPTINENVDAILNSLNLHEMRMLDAETIDNWENRKKRNVLLEKIRKEYPDGLKELDQRITSTKKPKNLSDEDIIREISTIKLFQQWHDLASAYRDWKKRQEVFATKYYNLCRQDRTNDGRYTYQVCYKRTTGLGDLVDDVYKIWQGFVSSFSSHYLEFQDDRYISRYNKIPGFKACTRYFTKIVYEQIFKLISDIYEYLESKPLTIFVNSSNYGWSKDAYEYHYRQLRELLDSNKFPYCDYESLHNIKETTVYEGVVVIDLITSNDEMTNKSKLIIEHFTRHVPVIGYYSFIKEYSDEEIKKIFEPDVVKNNDIAFIKKQFERVIKNEYFSYIAIINTILGEAGGADKTKKIWLDAPDKYELRFMDGDNTSKMVANYSVDGGITYTVKEYEGDSFSIEDVVKMSYDILLKMGILKNFKSKGAKAIDFMNEQAFLAYH